MLAFLTNQRQTKRDQTNNEAPASEREKLALQICSVLKSGQSLYLKGEAGIGKTWLANRVFNLLKKEEVKTAKLSPGSAKDILTEVAESFGIDTLNEKEKPLSTNLLKKEITQFLLTNSCVLICDNLPQIPSALRLWLGQLHTDGQPILGTGKTKPEKDLIFKLVAYEIEPMQPWELETIASTKSHDLGIEIDTKKVSQHAGGNPGTLLKLIKKNAIANLGLKPKEETEPTRVRGLQNVIILGIMTLALCRYIGKDPLLFAAGASMVASRIANTSLKYKRPT
jgi:hypothetical protein